ncbi:hypothetical protein F511_21056 [Dorcoceras hygrometricum]|uniref:Uncharacterized protein n=1 Tax=Dorcoceras hygrometricum TaxID=472368 RepID=A0A2Z7D6C7_9LAMI|nr:hypothetical protein F511_21056 [Dorcoceras hygrometricum]
MSDNYDILIPNIRDRGLPHLYLNHIEVDLRFPVPRFIQNLCDHLEISPSQLTPNSYSSLLALGIRGPRSVAHQQRRAGKRNEGLLQPRGTPRKKPTPQEVPAVDLGADEMGSSLIPRSRPAADPHPEPAPSSGTSFIEKTVAANALSFFQYFTSDADLPIVESIPEKVVMETLASYFMQLSWRVSNARELAPASRRSLENMLARQKKLMTELKELQTEMQKMKDDVEASWTRRKDDFLKSSEFDKLCSLMALTFFEHGFSGCCPISVDWTVKMRIRPPELETSICDVKYHVSLVGNIEITRCVLGKWVYLVTHAMSLFDLRDVCMVIGSLATLDLPMIVDLIGIFVLKGPYCTLTMTNWFLQALSVIPRESWDDVARRFTMIRWGPNCYFGLGGPKNCFRIIILSFVNCVDRFDLIVDRDYDGATVMDLKQMCTLGLGPTQTDEGIKISIVDRIRRTTTALPLKCRFPREIGRSQAPRRQQEELSYEEQNQLRAVVVKSSSELKADKKLTEPAGRDQLGEIINQLRE